MGLIQSIQNLIRRAKQTDTADDSGDRQKVKVKFMGQTREIKQVTPYGFYSSSPIGSEYVIFSARSNPDDLVGIGNFYKERFKDLQEGEVVIGNATLGSFVKFHFDGAITIESEGDVEVNAKGDANVTATGDITLKATNITTDATNTTIKGLVDIQVGVSGVAGPTNTVTFVNGVATLIT